MKKFVIAAAVAAAITMPAIAGNAHASCLDGGKGTKECGRNAATALGAAIGSAGGPGGAAIGTLAGPLIYDALDMMTDRFTSWLAGV